MGCVPPGTGRHRERNSPGRRYHRILPLANTIKWDLITTQQHHTVTGQSGSPAPAPLGGHWTPDPGPGGCIRGEYGRSPDERRAGSSGILARTARWRQSRLAERIGQRSVAALHTGPPSNCRGLLGGNTGTCPALSRRDLDLQQ